MHFITICTMFTFVRSLEGPYECGGLKCTPLVYISLTYKTALEAATHRTQATHNTLISRNLNPTYPSLRCTHPRTSHFAIYKQWMMNRNSPYTPRAGTETVSLPALERPIECATSSPVSYSLDRSVAVERMYLDFLITACQNRTSENWTKERDLKEKKPGRFEAQQTEGRRRQAPDSLGGIGQPARHRAAAGRAAGLRGRRAGEAFSVPQPIGTSFLNCAETIPHRMTWAGRRS